MLKKSGERVAGLICLESESFHAKREFVRRNSNRERIDGNLEVEAPKMV